MSSENYRFPKITDRGLDDLRARIGKIGSAADMSNSGQ